MSAKSFTDLPEGFEIVDEQVSYDELPEGFEFVEEEVPEGKSLARTLGRSGLNILDYLGAIGGGRGAMFPRERESQIEEAKESLGPTRETPFETLLEKGPEQALMAATMPGGTLLKSLMFGAGAGGGEAAAKGMGFGELGQSVGGLLGGLGKDLGKGAVKAIQSGERVMGESGIQMPRFATRKPSKFLKPQVSQQEYTNALENVYEQAENLTESLTKKRLPILQRAEKTGETLDEIASSMYDNLENVASKIEVPFNAKELVNENNKLIESLSKETNIKSDATQKAINKIKEKNNQLIKKEKKRTAYLDPENIIQFKFETIESPIKTSYSKAIKDYREINKDLSDLYGTIEGSSSKEEVKNALDQFQKNFSTSLKNQSKDIPEFYQAFEKANNVFTQKAKFEDLQKIFEPIFKGEKFAYKQFENLFTNPNKRAEIIKIAGKDYYNDLNKIYKDVKRIRQSGKDLKQYESGLTAFIPKYLAKSLLDLVGMGKAVLGKEAGSYLYGQFLLRPEIRRDYTKFIDAVSKSKFRQAGQLAKRIEDKYLQTDKLEEEASE